MGLNRFPKYTVIKRTFIIWQIKILAIKGVTSHLIRNYTVSKKVFKAQSQSKATSS